MTQFAQIRHKLFSALLLMATLFVVAGCEDDKLYTSYSDDPYSFTQVTASNVKVVPSTSEADISFDITPASAEFNVRLLISRHSSMSDATTYTLGAPVSGHCSQCVTSLISKSTYYYRIEAYSPITVKELGTATFITK